MNEFHCFHLLSNLKGVMFDEFNLPDNQMKFTELPDPILFFAQQTDERFFQNILILMSVKLCKHTNQ